MRLLILVLVLFSSICLATGEPKNPEEECDDVLNVPAVVGQNEAPKGGTTALVIVGYAEDGTPILQATKIFSLAPVAHSRQEPARATTQSREVADTSLDRILKSMSSMDPSPEALQAMMGVSADRAGTLTTAQVEQYLRKDLNPFAVVFLANMAYLNEDLDIVTDEAWLKIAEALDNGSIENFPDFALVFSKVAADLLIHARIENPRVREKVLRQLKASGKYDDDIQVAFRAGVAYLLNGERNSEIESRLRNNLMNEKLPKDLRKVARRILESLTEVQGMLSAPERRALAAPEELPKVGGLLQIESKP